MKKLIFAVLILFALCRVDAQTQKRVEIKKEGSSLSNDEPLRARFVESDTGKIVIPVTEKQNPLDEIDSIVQNETEIIDRIFFEGGKQPYPSYIWYRDNLSDQRVKLGSTSIDSLPDEIIITLVKRNESPFCFPVKNIMTSPYGWRWNRPHRGVDIRLKTGDPVYCCFDGVVRIARSLGNYGNLVVVRHYNGLETVYGHLSKINVKPMQVIKAGDVLGLGGSTGRSTGPHLHFEVRFQYEPFDPEWILDFQNYSLRTTRLYLNKSYFGIQKPKSEKDVLAYKADDSLYPEEKVKKATSSSSGLVREEVYHKVKNGETLASIASKYKVTRERLKQINKLKTSDIYPGQVLRIF